MCNISNFFTEYIVSYYSGSLRFPFLLDGLLFIYFSRLARKVCVYTFSVQMLSYVWMRLQDNFVLPVLYTNCQTKTLPQIQSTCTSCLITFHDLSVAPLSLSSPTKAPTHFPRRRPPHSVAYRISPSRSSCPASARFREGRCKLPPPSTGKAVNDSIKIS